MNLEKMDPSMLMAAAAAAGIDPNMGSGEEDRPLSIEEEYNLWKSNVPLMYDFVSETELVWPSLTMQWLPHGKGPISRNTQQMILGTHTSGEEQNYLKIAAITLPDEVIQESDEQGSIKKEDSEEEEEEYVQSNIRIVQKFEHDEEVNRARYMPQDANIIATINGSGVISIFDRESEQNKAIRTLKYHKDNGYGLSFNPNWEGHLLSGSDDHTMALWDISKTEPIQTWETAHSDIVNDCKWNNFNKDVFGSVSEDSTLKIHDLRNDKKSTSLTIKSAYNTIAFSKHSQYLFAAAGTDSNIYLYDMRSMQEPLHAMDGHKDAVTNLEFFEHKDGIIMSSGADRRAIVWDITDIGKEQIVEDAEDATPEVVMIHAGHRSAINDMSINPNIPWLMATCEEENIVQVWKCSSKLPNVGGTPKLDEELLKKMIAE